ncbi:MAG: hypothetical protein AAGE61_11445 [Pseudomonadota bacterium]
MRFSLYLIFGGLFAIAIMAAAHFWLGTYLDPDSNAQRTANSEPISVTVGDTGLRVPQNVIRFRNQRTSELQERLDLHMHWPTLEGYSQDRSEAFEQETTDRRILFLTIEAAENQASGQRKLQGLYRRFFKGKPWRGPGGLIGQQLDPASGFGTEDLFYGRDAQGDIFVTRCLRDEAAAESKVLPTCLYDYPVSSSLSATVRFDRGLLEDWQDLSEKLKRRTMGFLEK